MTGNPEVISSPVGLVPTNALLLIEVDSSSLHGWQPVRTGQGVLENR